MSFVCDVCALLALPDWFKSGQVPLVLSARLSDTGRTVSSVRASKVDAKHRIPVKLGRITDLLK